MSSDEESSDSGLENPIKKPRMHRPCDDEIISAEGEKILETLTTEEVLNFLDLIADNIEPSMDKMMYKTASKKLDWAKVKFKDFNASQCEELYNTIQHHQRKYRTLREIIVDSKLWIEKYRAKKNKGPTKPVTAYMIFFSNEYKKMKDKVSCIEAAKVISSKYKTLPPDEVTKLKEEYRAQMATFKEEHPEYLSKKEMSKLNSIKSPFRIFTDEMSVEYPNEDPKVLQSILKDRWDSLDDYHKAYYIQLSKQAFIERCVPGFNGKSAVSREEEKLYRKAMGVPTKPASNAFSAFYKEFVNMPENAALATKEKMPAASVTWKEMSEEERKQYKAKCKDEMRQYVKDVSDFEKKLSAAELVNYNTYKILPWTLVVAENCDVENSAVTEGTEIMNEFPQSARKFFQQKTGQKKKAWKALGEEEKQRWTKKFEKRKRKHEKKNPTTLDESQEINFTLEPPLYNSTPMPPQNHLVNGKRKRV